MVILTHVHYNVEGLFPPGRGPDNHFRCESGWSLLRVVDFDTPEEAQDFIDTIERPGSSSPYVHFRKRITETTVIKRVVS